MTFNPLANPLQPTPGGHVSRGAAELVERQAIRMEILREREDAARTEIEAEITRRINERRGVPAAHDREAAIE